MPKRAKPIRPPPSDSRPQNKLLACLPRVDFERLRPHLKTIPLKAKQILHPVNEPVRHGVLPEWRRRVDDDGHEERRHGGNRDGR